MMLRECRMMVLNTFPKRHHPMYKDKAAVRDRIRTYIKLIRTLQSTATLS